MATSASSVSKSRFRIDPKAPLWNYVTMLEQIPRGGGYIWICNTCNVRYSSSYSRVKAHLCALPSQGIRACPGSKDAPVSKSVILQYIKEQEDADALATLQLGHPLAKKRSRSKKPPTAPSHAGNPFVVAPHPFSNTPSTHEEDSSLSRKRTKGPLEKAFQNESRDIADQMIARCVYANGLSFNVVRSPYWQDMVKAINDAPKGYQGPGYEKVRTTLLTKEFFFVEDSLQPIRNSWVETGLSIVSDGWKDAQNRPLINVIAISPKGAMFLKAVDCEGQVKDAQFIANILIEAIESVGSQNVVQVITDNAKNCRAAGMLVEARYGNIFWTPCAAHSLNLILQKLGKQIEWIKEIYAEAEDIQMFVTNHHMSQAIFRQFSKLEVLKVIEARFASHTIVLRRLVKVREALQSMVISNLWSVWRQSSTERAQKIKMLILNDDWWGRVDYLLKITEPIISMIRFVDMDQPCLGEVYDGIDSMIEKIKAIINAKEQDPHETFFKQVQSFVIERWNKMTTPLHLLAFALSPRFYSSEILSLPGRVAPYKDIEVSEGYKAAFRRLYPDPEIEDIVSTEFGDFICSIGHSLSACRDKYKKDAHMWWYLHGQTTPTLQSLAIKILSQVASSSSSERNWSTYSFIHSQKRNKLVAKKAEELVYVHSNLRILSHMQSNYREGPTKHWDVRAEDVYLDASHSHDLLLDIEALASPSQPSGVGVGASASGSGSASASVTATACGSNESHVDVDASDEDIENELKNI